jgi:hypothetical protein
MDQYADDLAQPVAELGTSVVTQPTDVHGGLRSLLEEVEEVLVGCLRPRESPVRRAAVT